MEDSEIHLFRTARITRTIAAASFTLLVWDHLVTFERERRAVWMSNWGIAKVLFVSIRYFVPLSSLFHLHTLFLPDWSTSFCVAAMRFHTIELILTVTVVELVLLLRGVALWASVQWVRNLLYAAYGASVIASFATVGVKVSQIKEAKIHPIIRGCTGTGTVGPAFFWTIFIPALSFELLLFICTIVKARRHGRSNDTVPLIGRLTKDGSVYFVFAFLSMLMTAIGSSYRSVALPAMASNFLSIIFAISASRLQLRLRELYDGPDTENGIPMRSVLNGIARGAKVRQTRTDVFVDVDVIDEEGNVDQCRSVIRTTRAGVWES